jgi:hypothetical protein
MIWIPSRSASAATKSAAKRAGWGKSWMGGFQSVHDHDPLASGAGQALGELADPAPQVLAQELALGVDAHFFLFWSALRAGMAFLSAITYMNSSSTAR